MLPFIVAFWKWKLFFLISLAIPRPSRSGIHWPINFSKKIDNSVYFQQQQKVKNWREEKVYFSFLNCPTFVTIFVKFWKWKYFFFTSLAIPRPSRSGIHWPINFSKKIDDSVYFQKTKQKCKTEEKRSVISAFEIVQTLLPFFVKFWKWK